MSSTHTLPPEVERLLRDVVADGFVLYCCGRRTDPTALVASYEWERYIDLVVIRDFDRIITARIPKAGRVDVFDSQTVVWAYEGPAEHALRALLSLVPHTIPTPPPPPAPHRCPCAFPATSSDPC
ncbi:MAG: hypothetical protein ACRDTG_25415 [Pseudonocardiaceae bacterium]